MQKVPRSHFAVTSHFIKYHKMSIDLISQVGLPPGSLMKQMCVDLPGNRLLSNPEVITPLLIFYTVGYYVIIYSILYSILYYFSSNLQSGDGLKQILLHFIKLFVECLSD